jgi:hypothetical protein
VSQGGYFFLLQIKSPNNGTADYVTGNATS